MAINAVKEDEESQSSSKKATLLRLFRYLLAYKMKIILVLVIMLGCVTITLVNPLLIEKAIDTYIAKKDMKGLLRLGVFACVINLILVILIKIRMYIMAEISNKVLLTIREELYSHIQTLSFYFFDSRPTGKILARIIGDVNSLKEVLANSVTKLIPDFITIFSVVVIMFIKNWRLALASLSSLPFMLIGVWIVQNKAHKRWQIFRKKGSNVNAFVHEDISGMYIIQSFAAEKETQETFDTLLEEHKDSYIDAVRVADAFGPIVDLCWGVGTLMLYYVGIKMIGADNVAIGTLIAFGTYIGMFWQPVLNLSNFYNQLITNIAGAERIFEIMDTQADIVDDTKVKELPPIQGEVAFDKVSFEYDENSKVLNDISFVVNPGETVALVGPTGAGKSTIVNLISRFYDIQKGTIAIDGYDVREISIESLRQQMGIMTQDNFLFSGSVKDNIKYGKLDATEEEVIKAAKAVNAHDFIMEMEQGYETVLKERGAGLSVGQKQLLAFARTMISEPKILILDEATSSIDTHTEILVQKGIEALLKGRTSFVIAHRLSTIQNADRIFVIDRGIIVEQGSAKELMDKKGAYYELYQAQFANVI